MKHWLDRLNREMMMNRKEDKTEVKKREVVKELLVYSSQQLICRRMGDKELERMRKRTIISNLR
jgi:hypothetical protein